MCRRRSVDASQLPTCGRLGSALPSRATAYFLVRFVEEALRLLGFFEDVFGLTRSGSSFLPVERFHSSYCSFVILPSIKSSANFRRCALLLNGIKQSVDVGACHGELALLAE